MTCGYAPEGGPRSAASPQEFDAAGRQACTVARLEEGLAASAADRRHADPVRADPLPLEQPSDTAAAARSQWPASGDAAQHAARLEGVHRAAVADSTWLRGSAEAWRRHEHGVNSATPHRGMEL